MSQLPVAEDPSTRQPRGWKLLKSISTGVTSAVSDANLIVLLIVFIIVCLLALYVNVITSDGSLAIPQFGSYPQSIIAKRPFRPGDDVRPPEFPR
jgi:hypothetical protein